MPRPLIVVAKRRGREGGRTTVVVMVVLLLHVPAPAPIGFLFIPPPPSLPPNLPPSFKIRRRGRAAVRREGMWREEARPAATAVET